MLRASGRTVHRARALRRQMTLPEVVLWKVLRKRPDGLKFRKQYPAGEIVLDFFCAEAKLCIEVDGAYHDRGDQPDFDENRDAWLALHGVSTLRLNGADILRDLDAAVICIVDTCRQRLTPPPLGFAERSPSPCRGGSKESHP